MNIERSGIYVANLDPTIGHEIAKTRPVIVVSNNINNRLAGTVTVLPITSTNLGYQLKAGQYALINESLITTKFRDHL